MDFSYSEEQNKIKELSSKIFQNNNEHELLRKIEESGSPFHKKLWKELASSGLLGTAFNKDLGGTDLGFVEINIILEQLGYHISNIPFIQTIVSTGMAINEFGSQKLRNFFIPKIISGELILTTALNETGRLDLNKSDIELKKINGVNRISGKKYLVSYAEESDFILIPYKDEENHSLCFIDTESKGLIFSKLETTTREPHALLTLEEVEIDDNLILCSSSKTIDVLNWINLRTITSICSLTIGVAQACLDMTVNYSKERKAFNRTIASFQAVGHRAANSFIDLSCLRLVTEQAISLLEHGKEAAREVSIAKIWSGDVAHRTSYTAQHLHGGMGADKDYALYRYCLWAKQLELTQGSSAYHLNNLGSMIRNSN